MQHPAQHIVSVIKMMFQCSENVDSDERQNGFAAPFVDEVKIDAKIWKQRYFG